MEGELCAGREVGLIFNELQTLANELLLSDTQAEIGVTVSILVISMTVRHPKTQ